MEAKDLEPGASASPSHWIHLSLGWGYNLGRGRDPAALPSVDNTPGGQENQCLCSEEKSGQHISARDQGKKRMKLWPRYHCFRSTPWPDLSVGEARGGEKESFQAAPPVVGKE